MSLSKIADLYYKLSVDLNQELTNNNITSILEELSKDLIAPTRSDEDDLRILIKRCVKYIYNRDNLESFYKEMETIHNLLLKFKQENFVPELLDFAMSEDIWNTIRSRNASSLFLNLIYNELQYLRSLPKLFI